MTVKTADGIDLHVESWGAGPTVVLAHAWGLDCRMWDYQVPALAGAGYRAVLYDRRGHGRSEVATDGYDLDTLAADVAAVVDALDLSELTIVGHSAGAQEALRYITNHGDERVAAVVLSAPVTPCIQQRADFPHGLPEADFEALRDSWQHDFGAWIEAGADAYYGDRDVSEALRQVTIRALVDTPLPVIIATHRTLTSADLRADLAALHLPVTVLHGTADASAPLEVTGEPTAQLAEHGRLVTIRGGGHGMYHAHSHEYNEALLAALARTRTSRRAEL